MNAINKEVAKGLKYLKEVRSTVPDQVQNKAEESETELKIISQRHSIMEPMEESLERVIKAANNVKSLHPEVKVSIEVNV